eukprot:2501127-Amphidinium_carterae.1
MEASRKSLVGSQTIARSASPLSCKTSLLFLDLAGRTTCSQSRSQICNRMMFEASAMEQATSKTHTISGERTRCR